MCRENICDGLRLRDSLVPKLLVIVTANKKSLKRSLFTEKTSWLYWILLEKQILSNSNVCMLKPTKSTINCKLINSSRLFCWMRQILYKRTPILLICLTYYTTFRDWINSSIMRLSFLCSEELHFFVRADEDVERPMKRLVRSLVNAIKDFLQRMRFLYL